MPAPGEEREAAGWPRALDPRTRLLAAAGAAFAFSMAHRLSIACLCLAVSLICAASSRPPIRGWLGPMAAANVFLVFMCLTIPAAMPGETVFQWGPLHWSREGMALAALIAVKGNAIALVFLTLAAGLRLPRAGCAMERLRVPSKLVFLFLFTGRLVDLTAREWKRLWTAAELRGFTPKNSLHTYRTLGGMVGLTLIHGMDRSRRMHEAMLLRGFDGTFRMAAELAFTRADMIFAACAVPLAVGLALANLWTI